MGADGGAVVSNLVRLEINRVFGELIFQPVEGAGVYHLYYLPHTSTGRSNYPTVEYPPPRVTTDPAWLQRHGLGTLAEARSLLLGKDLKLGIVSYRIVDSLLPETVLEQSEPDGAEVDIGTEIDLVVSAEE